MQSLSIDFETRSEVDLKKTGTYTYAAHPTTDIWVMGWAFDDDEPEIWIPAWTGEHGWGPLPARIVDHILAGGEIRGWNVGFERIIWQEIMVKRYGAPPVALEQWVDTAAEAAAMSLPRGLEKAAEVTGVSSQKDAEGHRLMLRMSRPRSRKHGTVTWWDQTEKLEQLYEYCKQDVRTERGMVKVLRRLTDKEREIWLLDQRINDRGIFFDRPLVLAAQEIADEAVLAAEDQIFEITRGEVTSVTQNEKLQQWLGVESVAKDPVKELLEGELSPEHRQVLQLRADVGKTSVAKLRAMLDWANEDDRLRGMLFYHAAGTGRWGGKGPQPHNYPRPETEDIEQYIPLVMAGKYDELAKVGPPMILVSDMLRSMLKAPPGHELIAGDYAGIEARVTNWFAGQDDILQMFRDGVDVYRHNAAKLLKIPVEEIKKPSTERQYGKFQELGAGFGMGWKKAISAANTAQYGYLKLTEEFAKEVIRSYRETHDKVVASWKEANEAVIEAVTNPGQTVTFGALKNLRAVVVGAYLYIVLPSGRPLVYATPKVTLAMAPWGKLHASVEFQGVNSVTRQWTVQRLYGGLIMENVVQGTARDIMAEGMLRLENHGYPIILTVHDEIVTEIPQDFGSLRFVDDLMALAPDWAAGLPIATESWRGERYRK